MTEESVAASVASTSIQSTQTDEENTSNSKTYSIQQNVIFGQGMCINSDIELMEKEKCYMEKAFFYAKEALSNQEVPVGCIFVYQDEVIALGRNTVNKTHNATRHAEINCIEQVNEYCKGRHLDLRLVFSNISVYVTVEPCIMCAAALYELSVKSVIFGCKNDRFGGQTVLNVGRLLNPVTVVKGGYREEEAMDLLKEFYKGTNPNAPPTKVKLKPKKDDLTSLT